MRATRVTWLSIVVSAICAANFSLARAAGLRSWQAGELEGLKFRILYPRDYQKRIARGIKFPLVLFLHGVGERGTDNQIQLKNGVELFATDAYRSRYEAVVVVPQCPPDKSWGGFSYATGKSVETKLSRLVGALVTDLSIDRRRLYVTGVSMGGYGTYQLLRKNPGLFAAGLPVAGATDPSAAGELKDIPIWAFHGEADRNVPPDHDRELYLAITSLGGLMQYTEYPGVGHNSWDLTYSDQNALDWLFNQHL